MSDFVVLVDKADERKLKEVLGKDPYSRDSFVLVGYTLKESKALGLEEGKYALYYSCGEEDVCKALDARLKEVPSAKFAQEPKASEIIGKIKAEEDQAASGFGSLFG